MLSDATLTGAMQTARKQAGLTQQEVSERLDVSQSWVSKLESANCDHQVESVLDYLDALKAELCLSILTPRGTI
jgi:transcriptional regulator with XRE-family HTH domain